MQTQKIDINYSIIICTYNPDQRLLHRCLQAVANLEMDGLNIEVIVVDNNSDIAVSTLPCVNEYAGKIPSMKIIFVAEQGVKYARMAAIEQSKGNCIVYFDYDNEPAPDYLQQLQKLQLQYPDVAAWGPGNITVDFIDGIDKNIESYARTTFQERKDTDIMFDNKREWQPCYPYGTGLCTFAFLLKEFVVMSTHNQFTLTGRKGNAASSGEDTQMVLFCISRGFAAGVSPTLRITHIISAKRANERYLQRLSYGTGLCYELCLLQVFPEYKTTLEKKLLSYSKFTRQSLKKYVAARWNHSSDKTFAFIQFIARNAGIYTALHKPIPSTVKKLIKYLKLE